MSKDSRCREHEVTAETRQSKPSNRSNRRHTVDWRYENTGARGDLGGPGRRTHPSNVWAAEQAARLPSSCLLLQYGVQITIILTNACAATDNNPQDE